MWEMSLLWLFLVAFTIAQLVMLYHCSSASIGSNNNNSKRSINSSKRSIILSRQSHDFSFYLKNKSLKASQFSCTGKTSSVWGGGLAGDACLLETTVASLAHFSQVPRHYQTATVLRANPATSEIEKQNALRRVREEHQETLIWSVQALLRFTVTS